MKILIFGYFSAGQRSESGDFDDFCSNAEFRPAKNG